MVVGAGVCSAHSKVLLGGSNRHPLHHTPHLGLLAGSTEGTKGGGRGLLAVQAGSCLIDVTLQRSLPHPLQQVHFCLCPH